MVYRASVSKLVVVEHPVVISGEHLVGASHEVVVCQTSRDLIQTDHKRSPQACRTRLDGGPARVIRGLFVTQRAVEARRPASVSTAAEARDQRTELGRAELDSRQQNFIFT
jgi:hypothetical protein